MNWECWTESKIERRIINFLKEDWDEVSKPKKKGKHGPDIIAKRKKCQQYQHLVIEVKGHAKNVANFYYALPTLIGQIICRMEHLDKSGNPYLWHYGIGIPQSYESVLKKRAKEMQDIWKKLKLKIYLVKKNGKIELRDWGYFLK